MERVNKYNEKNQQGITLIVIVITIIVLLIISGVSIAILTENNGILEKANETKIMTAIGAIKEEIESNKMVNIMNNKNSTIEELVADGKIKRTVQAKDGIYYMYYVIKPNVYQGMQELGKGTLEKLRDVFLIDDKFHVKYIDKKGKEYGDKIEEKILEDETEIRFSNQAFSDYVSKIAGISEKEMKFKWMKNQTSLIISDTTIDSLEDLIFFPNLISLELNGLTLENLGGIENCIGLKSLSIVSGRVSNFKEIENLTSLENYRYEYCYGKGASFDEIIENLKNLKNLKTISLPGNKIENISKISELSNIEELNLKTNNITKIEGLENSYNLISLNLSNNNITKVERLENLVNLKTLYLSNNHIVDITPLSFNISLITLGLDMNSQIDGNRNNYTGERLEKLNKIGEILDRNGIINIDIDKLGLFTNYKKLDLSSQKLTTLEMLEGLTELTSLILNNNQLTLEDEKSQEILKKMQKLELLSLNDNKITNVKAINNLKNLKQLNLNGIQNKIKLVEIEDIISNLDVLRVSTESFKTIVNCDVSKITRLNLRSSNLTEIPDLSKFTNLTEIQFSFNSGVTNWNNIAKLKNLQKLELNECDLHGKMIDFSQLTNLIRLDLNGNSLWTEDLENLKALKNNKNLTIILSNNSIIDASALLVLDTNCIINLKNNVNLKQESKESLKSRFANNVTF